MNIAIKNTLKSISFLWLLGPLVFFIITLAFIGTSQVRAEVDGSSSDSEIRGEVCGGTGAGSQEYSSCVIQVDDFLEACKSTDSSTGLTPEEQETICRQGVADAELGSTSTTRGSGAGSATSGGLDTDRTEENRQNPSEDAIHPDNCGITNYIRIFTNALSVLVGVVVIAMLVFGGIRYSSAGANPQAVASAKQHISNALLALAIYLFTFAFLQWIVPGGLL
ncbi:MAG: pilin [Actinobacteria bacterium]|nr:pilin [Actinomycetota bacterium]